MCYFPSNLTGVFAAETCLRQIELVYHSAIHVTSVDRGVSVLFEMKTKIFYILNFIWLFRTVIVVISYTNRNDDFLLRYARWLNTELVRKSNCHFHVDMYNRSPYTFQFIFLEQVPKVFMLRRECIRLEHCFLILEIFFFLIYMKRLNKFKLEEKVSYTLEYYRTLHSKLSLLTLALGRVN